MAIAASGAVSFSDLRTEFVGGSAAISYSDLYRGGSNIRTKASNNNGVNLAASVPSSGTINISNFRGTAKAFRYIYTSGATNQNASALFGDDYAVNYPKEIVINSGVELGATSVTNEALQIDSGGSGSITVTNNGTLSGAGAAFLGSVGGDAFEANIACTLINNGTIRSGGGTGGSGGQGSYTSTSTQGPSYSTASFNEYYWHSWTASRQLARWAGVIVGNSNPYYGTSYTVGNVVYARSTFVTSQFWKITKTTSSTSYSNGGYGGAGQGYNQSAGSGTSGGTNAGQGGTGGSFGQTGSTGVNGNHTNGTAGNAAGKSIRGISFVTFTDNGTVLGSTA